MKTIPKGYYPPFEEMMDSFDDLEGYIDFYSSDPLRPRHFLGVIDFEIDRCCERLCLSKGRLIALYNQIKQRPIPWGCCALREAGTEPSQ